LEVLSAPTNAAEINKTVETFDTSSLSTADFASTPSASADVPGDTFTDDMFGGVSASAKVIANRRPSEGIGLPSLEDLESEPTLSTTITAGETSETRDASFQGEPIGGASLGTPTVAPSEPAAPGQPLSTSTPNAITDWLKYAPEYPPAP
jgi:hypothetical protein